MVNERVAHRWYARPVLFVADVQRALRFYIDMLGFETFAAQPEAPPFVQVGDRVDKGQVLCIIEAMKLMNEIESEINGVIVKRFVSNAQPVEYGEALFAIEAG